MFRYHAQQITKEKSTRNLQDTRRVNICNYLLPLMDKKLRTAVQFFMSILNITDSFIRFFVAIVEKDRLIISWLYFANNMWSYFITSCNWITTVGPWVKKNIWTLTLTCTMIYMQRKKIFPLFQLKNTEKFLKNTTKEDSATYI